MITSLFVDTFIKKKKVYENIFFLFYQCSW